MLIYDTKSRRKVEFVPREEGKIGMYVCGPTVYNRIHIGNARTFISFDTIRRYLLWRGYDVMFVQNVTDVDDKIINRANEEGCAAAELAARYTEAFIEDMHAVGILDPDVRPKATEEIGTMIELVQTLIDRGHAYEVDGDVYFDVRSYAGYGGLSGRNIDEMESGHRELRADGQGIEDRKRDPLDFALWKAAKPGEPSWASPWGQGRPGWHIECSAMSHKYLGLPFDIHGGGGDLVFPHHENERAQSEAAYGTTFARYWMHAGMLQIHNDVTGEDEKMSKSLGNFMLLHEVLKTIRPQALRMLMLQTHYRSPLSFSETRLEEADAALTRIETAVRNLCWSFDQAKECESAVDGDALATCAAEARDAFVVAMDDDFNTAEALGAIFGLVASANTMIGDRQLSLADCEAVGAVRDTIVELLGTLGIDIDTGERAASWPVEVVSLAASLIGFAGDDSEAAVQALLDARAEARKAKDWGLSDAVRDGLAGLGLKIEDTPQGQRLVRD